MLLLLTSHSCPDLPLLLNLLPLFDYFPRCSPMSAAKTAPSPVEAPLAPDTPDPPKLFDVFEVLSVRNDVL